MGLERFDFWTRWLSTALVSVATTGVLLAIFDHRAVPFLPEMVCEVFWGAPEMPAEVVAYHRWLYGIIGALFVAWALALRMVVVNAFATRQRWAWVCVGLSVGAWYTIDTAASIVFGVWPNLPFNTVALLALGAPLVATRGAFRAPPQRVEGSS